MVRKRKLKLPLLGKYFKPNSPPKKFLANVLILVVTVIVAILINRVLNEKTKLKKSEKGAITFFSGFLSALCVYFILYILVGFGL